MNVFRWASLNVWAVFIITGCSDVPDPASSQSPSDNRSEAANDAPPELKAKIDAALAKLSPADQALAKAQKYCPVQKALLGTMGKPDRIEIQGQPVFLCCTGCADDARADPTTTLKLVAQFKKTK
jgi:hypothetical protein